MALLILFLGSFPIAGESLSLLLFANKAVFVAGDTMRISVGADNPSGNSGKVDAYFGYVLPDGESIVLFTTSGSEVSHVTTLDNLVPLSGGIDLAKAFHVDGADLLSYVWQGQEPAGEYRFFVAAVPIRVTTEPGPEPLDLRAGNRSAADMESRTEIQPIVAQIPFEHAFQEHSLLNADGQVAVGPGKNFDPRSVFPAGQRIAIFVPGFNNTPFDHGCMEAFIKGRRGPGGFEGLTDIYDKVLAYQYPSGTDIRANGQWLADVVSQAPPGSTIQLITYSEGGLVTLTAATGAPMITGPGLRGRLQPIIAIAPPFGGTRVALGPWLLGPGVAADLESVKQMLTGSSFLKDFAAADKSGIDVRVIAGRSDRLFGGDMVVNVSSATQGGDMKPSATRVLEKTAHVPLPGVKGLPCDEDVLDQIRAWANQPAGGVFRGSVTAVGKSAVFNIPPQIFGCVFDTTVEGTLEIDTRQRSARVLPGSTCSLTMACAQCCAPACSPCQVGPGRAQCISFPFPLDVEGSRFNGRLLSPIPGDPEFFFYALEGQVEGSPPNAIGSFRARTFGDCRPQAGTHCEAVGSFALPHVE